MKRWIYVAGGILVVVAAVVGIRAYAGSRLASALEDLQTVEAATGDLTAMVGATGSVRASQTAVLVFQTSGRVERVSVEVGERVRAGEVLAELAQDSLSPQVILAQADLVSAQRQLDQLRNSSLAAAQAALALAQARDALRDAEYDRIVQQEGNRASSTTIDGARARVVLAQDRVNQTRAHFNAVASRADTDAVRAAALASYSAARAELASAERALNWYLGHPSEIDQAILDANVALAEAQVADAEREWERLQDGPDPDDILAAEARVAAAQATADQARITAPFDGVITAVEVLPGDLVSPGTLAFGVADLSRLLVDVDVSEVDINRIQPGQPVTLSLDAVQGTTYEGTVEEVDLAGSSLQGVVNFRATVLIIESDELVRPGMTAAVNIVVERIEDVLLVPNRAVRVRDGQRVVYVLRGGVLGAVPVVLGASSDTDSQVLEGELNVGDLIVLNPPLVFDTSGPPAFVRQ
jgi:HlyD family secretion protein